MDRTIIAMLDKYRCEKDEDYKNALKEIVQEIVLLGLWRSKFFEHAAFYGGTALRILYGLDRYSEDLDFSLLRGYENFKIANYHESIRKELAGFGFEVEIKEKKKQEDSVIQSAFLKANTKEHLIRIGVPEAVQKRCHAMESLKVKFEVDIDPPSGFNTEVLNLIQPIPFWVRTYAQPDLFSGKIHALLCRNWNNRIKGRDWYDFLWYIRRDVKVNLSHLEKRMQQSGHISNRESLTLEKLKQNMKSKVETLNIELAIQDVKPFIRDQSYLDGWSKEIFLMATDQLKAT